MTRKQIESMDDEAIEKEMIALSDEKEKLRERQRALQDEVDRRHGAATAQRLAETLSSADRAALLQIIESEGIESEETAGTPGQ